MFEKYSKKRSDPDFCDGQRTEDRGGGIGHSSSWMPRLQYPPFEYQSYDGFLVLGKGSKSYV